MLIVVGGCNLALVRTSLRFIGLDIATAICLKGMRGFSICC